MSNSQDAKPVAHSSRTVSPETARSWLLVPASRPSLFTIAEASAADAIILDLEDAVAAHDKVDARENMLAWLNSGHRAWVRINDASSTFWSDDCSALEQAVGLEGIMLAKSESSAHIDDTAERLPDGTRILALVETARGLQRIEHIAHASATFRIAFGTGDFKRDTAAGENPLALAYARSQLVIASRAARLPAPIDGPTLDLAKLPSGIAHAKEMGMLGKLCLSHEHAGLINDGLSPAPEDVSWAHGFVRAFDESGGEIVDGSDLPRLARAQEIMRQAHDFALNVSATETSYSDY